MYCSFSPSSHQTKSSFRVKEVLQLHLKWRYSYFIVWVFLVLLCPFYPLCALLHSPWDRNAGWSITAKHPGCCSRCDLREFPQNCTETSLFCRASHSLILVAFWQLILKGITVCCTEHGSLKSYKFCNLPSNISLSWRFGCLATAKFGTHSLVQNH